MENNIIKTITIFSTVSSIMYVMIFLNIQDKKLSIIYKNFMVLFRLLLSLLLIYFFFPYFMWGDQNIPIMYKTIGYQSGLFLLLDSFISLKELFQNKLNWLPKNIINKISKNGNKIIKMENKMDRNTNENIKMKNKIKELKCKLKHCKKIIK